MAWADSVAILTSRYGSTAKKVAASVVTAMFPGCGIAVQLVESAFEIAKDAAKDHLDAQLIRVTKANSQDIGRLNQMMEHLTGSMAKVCSEAQTMLNNPERIQEMVCKALQDDPTLLKVQRSVDDLAGRFSVIERQNRQLLDGHDEMLPLLRRMSGLANFVDELTASGVTGRDLAQILRQKAEIQQKISHRQGADAVALLHALPASVQTVPSLLTLEAAARVVSHDYGEAVPLLRDAARQKPNDAELGEMWRQVTVVSGMAATPKPSSSGVSIPRVDAGMVLDGYRLESRLGSGGWGQVFRASKNGQVKALKVLHPELSRNPQVLERFKSEIKTLLKLPAHLNLVRVEDFGYCQERACWYLVMEYIDGPTLDQYLRSSKTLNPEQIRRVFQPLAQGLGLAHKAGFVHRDIKPGNMMFRKSDQRLVLIDFGLANHETDAGKEQIDGKTLMFEAPEQLRGKPADARSDVYSLTATMHFAVQYAQADLRDPDHFDSEKAPKSLRSVLAGGMETNPQRRFADGADLAEAMLLPIEVPLKEVVAFPAPLPTLPEFVAASSPKVREVKPTVVKRVVNQQGVFIAGVGVALVAVVLVGIFLLRVSELKTEHVAAVSSSTSVRHIGDTFEVSLTESIKMSCVWVPPGESWLGGGGGTEGNKHFVLEEGFWCGQYEVTQEQWQAVMGSNPSKFKGKRQNPVENISQNNIKEFLMKVNESNSGIGFLYRLPTEDEWEYIARGGPIQKSQSKYHFYFAHSKTDLTVVASNDLSSTQANFHKRPEGTCAVGTYIPNPLGIFDMHGNVWEWTFSEQINGNQMYRVYRGGGWDCYGNVCSAASRVWDKGLDSFTPYIGFRFLAVPIK